MMNQRAYAQAMASFVPETVKRYLYSDDLFEAKEFSPAKQSFNTAALFADISGFTLLSESLAKKGDIGCEELGFYLNRYLERIGYCLLFVCLFCLFCLLDCEVVDL